MRKLKLQVQMSVGGYVAGPNGELDFMTWKSDNRLLEYINSLTDSSDTILLGRKMTDGFIDYWTKVLNDPKNPEYSFAKKMIDTPKVVFSKTLRTSTWTNTTLASGDLTDEIAKLKNRPGKDIIVYGGASFVSSLIKEGLIDEYHLFIHPAAIGNGMTIFSALGKKQSLSLQSATSYDCGVTVLVYKPLKD